MKTRICILLFSSFVCACEIKVNTPSPGKDNPASKIRNDVKCTEKGLKVKQAFLLYEDGSLVEEGNKINVNEKVILRLVLDGFIEENGRVQPGATEKISTSEGQVLLESDDLFASYPDGMRAEEAGLLSLSAVITSIDKLYDYFLVQFRVWDKKQGGGEITGFYKLYLK